MREALVRFSQLSATHTSGEGAAPGERPPHRGRGWPAWTLAAVELLVAYQAVSGGIGLMTDSWHLPTSWLVHTPFNSWVGPGWVLIGLVAVPHVLAAIPVVLMPRRARLGILAGFLAGSSLLIWIATQIALLQIYFFLQPVIALIGLVEIGLALWWRNRPTSLLTGTVPTNEDARAGQAVSERPGVPRG
jgi:hypothetical protein